MKLKHVHPKGLSSEIHDYSIFEVNFFTFDIFVFQFKSDCLVINHFSSLEGGKPGKHGKKVTKEMWN